VHVITSNIGKNNSNERNSDGFSVHRCACLGILSGLNPVTFISHRLFKEKADIIHAHSYIFFTTNQAALARKIVRRPLLVHLHGGFDTPRRGRLRGSLFHFKTSFYDPFIGRWTVQAADAVASVSKYDIARASQVFGVDRKQIHWVPNAVELGRFKENNCCGDVVTFIGRLEELKGIRVFLESCKLIARKREHVRFRIVGSGSLRGYVEAESKRFNTDFDSCMEVMGEVSHEQIPQILSQTSVLVAPSYMEGAPTVCLEASASEVPVVASNVGGIPEMVVDGRTGFLFPSGDPEACAEKVSEILSNQKLRRRMGREARDMIKQYYTWEEVIKKVEGIYEKITG